MNAGAMTDKLSTLPWQTLPEMFDGIVTSHPDKIAVIDGSTQLTYRELSDRAEAIAHALIAAGVDAGDRVAIWLPNGWQWAACAFAAWKVGAVVVPVNTRFKGVELGHVLRLAEPKLIFLREHAFGNSLRSHFDSAVAEDPSLTRPVAIDADPTGECWRTFLAAGDAIASEAVVARTRAVTPEDLADIIMTSGTTGFPKGVMATHAQDVRAFYNLGIIEDMTEDDVLGIVLPFFHTFGFKAGLLVSTMVGATICIFDHYDATTLIEAIEQHGITFLPGPPAIFHGLLDHPRRDDYDLSSLRLAIVGSTFVPAALLERLENELRFDHIVSSYGLTEATGVVTQCRIGDPMEVNLNSIGRPQPEVEVRIWADGVPAAVGEVGEIQVRGYNVTSGYYRDPETTAQLLTPDGWLKTGDLGELRPDGYFAFRGRMREMLIIGGFNAYPLEIENCLRHHPDVQDVAVLGAPHERLGEIPAAFVVLNPGAVLSEEDLQVWTSARIANFKVPKIWRFMPALPTNASGKVAKAALSNLLSTGEVR